jgi:outer membrane immunogenic protein
MTVSAAFRRTIIRREHASNAVDFTLSVAQKQRTPTWVRSDNTRASRAGIARGNRGDSEMKKLLLAGAVLTALSCGSALAADLRRPAYTPPPPVYSWTGFYIGGNLGGAWANGNVNDSLFGLSASTNRSGFIGGGQLGVNYQFSNIVLGAEWDFDWTSLDATGNGRFVPGVGTLQGSANTRWISTLAARFGVVLNNGVLLYGKAGGGWVDNNASITNLTTGASISASNRNSGWVVGAGVEWAIAGNWSAKLEYDYLKLDNLTFGPGPFLGNTFTTSRDIQMFKVGLNYRFGYGGPAYGGPAYGGPAYGGPAYGGPGYRTY